jgi:hypothetical protein
MTAILCNKRIVGNDDFFDLFFFDDENNQLPLSLSGVIFISPYTSTEVEEKIREIALNLYPDFILKEIVFE